ncbi:MAG: sigma-70 family RNA polymerase sigma factor [Planctomycetes bacterium]|nr:sigma-70 family RNA polymerase sigma factor [Planctomycetota bacterium]
MDERLTPSEAYAQQLTSSQPALYGYIMSLVGDYDTAQDVLQQVNLVLWRKAGEFEAGTPFMAWACRVAYFEVLTARKQFARSRLVFDDALLMNLADAAAASADQSEARRKALGRCLAELSPTQRELLERHYAGDETVRAIAESMQRPLASLYQTMYRIRIALLKCIARRIEIENPGGEA